LRISDNREPFSYQDALLLLKDKNIHISDTTLKYYIKILSNNKILRMVKEKPFKVFKLNNNIKGWKVPKSR
jgi:hypothetical protein